MKNNDEKCRKRSIDAVFVDFAGLLCYYLSVIYMFFLVGEGITNEEA